jgi:hypothetical protein
MVELTVGKLGARNVCFIHRYYVLKSILVVERNINTWGVTALPP